jgi:hypothetical protein
MLLSVAIAGAVTGGAGLTLTQGPGNSSDNPTSFGFNPNTMTATFGQASEGGGAGPFGINVASTLPGLTAVTVSAATPRNEAWLQVAPADSSGACPANGDLSYSGNFAFTLGGSGGSQIQTVCVLALPMPGRSLYAGTLSFQSQAGTTIVPVSMLVTPAAYLQVFNGNAQIPSGYNLTFQQPANLSLRVMAVDPNSNSSVDVPVTVAPTAGAAPDWLSISNYDLPGLPATLSVGVNPTAIQQTESTILSFQSMFGYGSVEFTIQAQPSTSNPLPNPLVAVWRPLNGIWYLAPPLTPTTTQWGAANCIPVPADYDGDGKIDVAVWWKDTGTWFIRLSSNSTPLYQQWGLTGDVPVPGDYDGDGQSDFAVWRPDSGTWFVQPRSGGDPLITQWGVPGDIPVPADYGQTGHTQMAVWRPSNGNWYIFPNAAEPTQWGLPGDIPVPADYDGDGKVDLAVWRPSNGVWYIIPSSQSQPYLTTQWGEAGDVPVPGDYDGDGKIDLAVWRPSNGSWYILPSSKPGTQTVKQWGLPGDIPLAKIPSSQSLQAP